MTRDGAVGALTLAYFSTSIRINEAVARFSDTLRETSRLISDSMGAIPIREEAIRIAAMTELLN